jgi:hypothetical protein
MRDRDSGEDVKAIWQSQPTGASVMTLQLIRSKARGLRAKTRRQLLGTITGPLAAGFFYLFGIRVFPGLGHILHPLFAVAVVWSVVGLYFLNRGMWSRVMPGDAGLRTGLEFCRGEVERRSQLLQRVLLWSFGPVLLAIATFVVGLAKMATEARGIFPNGLPFLSLVVLWIFGYFAGRVREQRELKREIDELDDLERSNSR